MTEEEPMSYGLGGIIKMLEKADPAQVVALGFGSPHSYRGYYEDLAFEPMPGVTVGEMLKCAKESLGKTFTGYKGGEYTMHEHTQCWLSKYGEASGESLGPTMLNFMLGTRATPQRSNAEEAFFEAALAIVDDIGEECSEDGDGKPWFGGRLISEDYAARIRAFFKAGLEARGRGK